MTNETARRAQRTVLVTGGSRGIGAAARRLCAQRRLGGRRQLRARRAPPPTRVVARDRREPAAARSRVQADVAERRRRCGRCSRRSTATLPPLGGLVNNAGVVDLAGARRRDERRAARSACSRSTSSAASTARARRSGACRRATAARGRRDRQRLVGGGQARRARAVRRLRRRQGRDRRPSRSASPRKSRAKASASTRSGPASSRPTSTPPAATPTASRRWRRSCRCSAPARADEVAEAIVWLLSDASSYTTGVDRRRDRRALKRSSQRAPTGPAPPVTEGGERSGEGAVRMTRRRLSPRPSRPVRPGVAPAARFSGALGDAEVRLEREARFRVHRVPHRRAPARAPSGR